MRQVLYAMRFTGQAEPVGEVGQRPAGGDECPEQHADQHAWAQQG